MYSLDLPFYVPLNEEVYTLNVGGRAISVTHSRIVPDERDSRLGEFKGTLGFKRDRLGLLQFSRLTVDLPEDDLDAIARFLSGRPLNRFTGPDHEIKGQVVLTLFNYFLDKYRLASRVHDVKPIGRWDLARLRFDDGRTSGDVFLYGGGITLPVVGLAPKAQENVVHAFQTPEPPEGFLLGALDARRAVEDGTAREAILIAVGALESAVDTYLARSWRLARPVISPQDAAKELGFARAADVLTIDDVLEKAAISSKLKTSLVAGLSDTQKQEALQEAIEIRNLVVHAGIELSVPKAKLHIAAITSFVLDELWSAIQSNCRELPEPDLFYAYAEAMGTKMSAELENVARTYLSDTGVSVSLYNRKAKAGNMFSERFGNSLIMRVSFKDFSRDQIDLFVGQSILHHWLEQRGDIAFVRVGQSLPNNEERPFWSAVARELTRAVWGAAIDRRLKELGLDVPVDQQSDRDLTELLGHYNSSYVMPTFDQLSYWVDYLELARVAAALPQSGRADLLSTAAGANPKTAQRAARALLALDQVQFDDPASILETSIRVHDAHESILASVSVFDPVTNRYHGLGLTFEDIQEITKLL